METTFHPPRRSGMIFMATLLLIFLAGSIWSFNRVTGVRTEPGFGTDLLLFAAFSLPLPLIGYRLYALSRSSYSLLTGSIRLVWGLRFEEIPLEEVTWVRTERELGYRLPLPLLSWPGAVVGVRRRPRKGRVEFMASRRRGLILIETNRRAFAISPEDPARFLQALQRVSEEGSLEPVRGESVDAAALVGSVWARRLPRNLIASGLVAAVGFAVWVFFGAAPPPDLAYPLGTTGRSVTGAQLLVLPVLNGMFTLMDLLLGLFFYRREDTRPLAYLLWVCAVLVSGLFFVAVGLLI
ncbi:MAG TPA: PH domain-containing protein [Anaerolineales bacterium]|nr:PH domain-containing protein [Anaerolineales bacterium]